MAKNKEVGNRSKETPPNLPKEEAFTSPLKESVKEGIALTTSDEEHVNPGYKTANPLTYNLF